MKPNPESYEVKIFTPVSREICEKILDEERRKTLYQKTADLQLEMKKPAFLQQP